MWLTLFKYGRSSKQTLLNLGYNTDAFTSKCIHIITRAVRHRVLNWAQFVCLFSLFLYYFCGRLPVFMLIGWRASNMSSMSSGEEQNEMFPSEVLALLAWTVC